MTNEVEAFLAEQGDVTLEHSGVKGMKWGVRRDERLLGEKDKALNMTQRSQVKLASAISALAAIGITSNAAATAFQLQSRWEHLQIVKAVMEQAENNPYINDAGQEALRLTRNKIVKGLVASAMMTTAVSATIGVVTHRTAKAYFAPMHKVYGDVKPKINSDLKKLSKDVKAGRRPTMTTKEYNSEVSKIVEKHMTDNKSNILKPFHELARTQLGTEYNTKKMNITFQKLPNTDLYSKMTIVTPQGLKLVKAIKNVEHSALAADGTFKDLDLYFDYKFDSDGYIVEFSSPTIEIAHEMLEGQFDLDSITERFGDQSRLEHSDIKRGGSMTHEVETFLAENAGEELAHFGIKGMKWGIRRSDSQLARASKVQSAEGRSNSVSDGARAAAASKQLKKGGLQALSNDDIQFLANRLRLETSLAEAKSSQTGVFTKIDKKTKKLLGFGATANTAIAFAVSPTGRLLLQKFAPSSSTKTLTRLALAGAGGNKLREDLGLVEPKDKKK